MFFGYVQYRHDSLRSRIDSLEQELKDSLELNRPEASREDQITSAVSAITPSVVSLVVSKDVPLLEVVYVNPFGDDPRRRNLNIRVPVYRQRGTEEKQVGAGTGFIITSNGYIVTNSHVVDDPDARFTALLSSGEQAPATLVYRDEKNDIAFLKVEGDSHDAVDFGRSDELRLGQTVFAVGNALGEFGNTISVGIISGLNRDIEAVSQSSGQTESLSGVIQTDAAINPGNSGGPLVNLSGQVVGVNVATVRGSENIGFAIPIQLVRELAQNVLKINL